MEVLYLTPALMNMIISIFGYFFWLFSHEMGGLNKNELKWNPVLAAIWYINYSLNLWSRIALAKFPQFLHFLCLLHVKQKALMIADLAGHGPCFYLTRSRYEDIPSDLQRWCGMDQTISINKKIEICDLFSEVNVRCVNLILTMNSFSGSRCEVITNTFFPFLPSIKVQDLSTITLVIRLWNKSFIKLFLNYHNPTVKII